MKGLTRIYPDVRIGPMTLITGNCLEILAGITEDADKADLLATDPPYSLTRGGKNSGSMSGKFADDRYDNGGDLMHITAWADMAKPIFDACRPNCDGYVTADSKNIFLARNAFLAAKWKLHNLLHWKKPTPTRTRFYMKDTEYVLYLWKGRARDIRNGGSKQSMTFPRPSGSIHPTQKPIEVLRIFIENSSEPGDLVLDPFSGSGTTLVAAMLSGRRALGCEMNTEFVDASAQWLRQQWDAHRASEDERLRILAKNGN